MKYLVANILIASVLALSLRTWFPVGEYLTHLKSYQEICEFKNQPMLHCNGKCALAKKLAAYQASEQEANTPPETPPVQEDISLFCEQVRPFQDPLFIPSVGFAAALNSQDVFLSTYAPPPEC